MSDVAAGGAVLASKPAERSLPGVNTLIVACLAIANLFLLVWLIASPPHRWVSRAVDDYTSAFITLTAGAWCFLTAARCYRAGGEDGTHPLRAAASPLLLGFGILAFGGGDLIWSYYEVILRRDTPFPSLADAAYILSNPLLLAGALFLPRRRLPAWQRGRVLLDGFITITAVFTVVWYFLLGPNLLLTQQTFLGKLLGAAYPLGDLMLLFALMYLEAHERDHGTRAGIRAMCFGIIAIIFADIAFAYGTLKGTYASGSITDLGWTIGYTLLAFGASGALTAPSGESGEGAQESLVWQSVAPYALVPLAAVVTGVSLSTARITALEAGALIGFAVLILVILVRQILSITEHARLNARLTRAYCDLEHKNAMLQTLAGTDSMTGLANHGAFQQRLKEELSRAARSGRPLSLLLIDVDFFKQYNDAFGHPAGDEVLTLVARILKETVREEDLTARYGGEEFAIIVADTDSIGAAATAERIRIAVAAHPMPHRHVTVSIGIASIGLEGSDGAGLIARADRALYAAKRGGRNMVAVWSPGAADRPAAVERSGSPAPRALGEDFVTVIPAGFEGRMLRGILAALDLRDCETNGHSQRVAGFTVRLAEELERLRGRSLPHSVRQEMMLGALLHDIGKIGVPDSILHKRHGLTEQEWEVIRRHPAQGAAMLAELPELSAALPIVLYHHERWDGTGYPHGLRGTEIPLVARVFAVADAMDAMGNDRPYRDRMTFARIRAEIQAGAGTQFDPEVVQAFLNIDESEWAWQPVVSTEENPPETEPAAREAACAV